MTAFEQFHPYQNLFDYLAKQLNVIPLQTEMQEIEAIVMSKHEQQIKDSYNQGFRDGVSDAESYPNISDSNDVSVYENAQNYYNETFKK